MNCVCNNIMNRLQASLSNLLTTAANNRINSGLSSTDDGNYRPNLNLLDNNPNNNFDLNTFFYVLIILITLFSFTSMVNSRRRRIGGNTSSLN